MLPPLLQGSPRLLSMPIRVFSRSAHVAGLVTPRQTFVRRAMRQRDGGAIAGRAAPGAGGAM